MSGDELRHLGPALPLDDVGSNDVDLVGRLAELGRPARALRRRPGGAPRASPTGSTRWAGRSASSVTSPPDDAWQVAQFEQELARTLAAAGGAAGAPLRLADVRALLVSRLGGRPTRANFRTGTLTVCTMVPMRSVPHRVVCLVGLDDGVFPARPVDRRRRRARARPDDRRARRPQRGPAAAARRGARGRRHARRLPTPAPASTPGPSGRPPYRSASCSTPSPRHRRRGRLRRPPPAPAPRPPQPAPGVLGTPAPFSFDTAALAGARAAAAERRPPAPFLPVPLPPPEPGDVNLDDLVRFLLHPVREFLRGPMALGTAREADEVLDGIPIDLTALEQWDIGDRFVGALLDGADAGAVFLAEQLRGSVPPGQIGTTALREDHPRRQALLDQTAGAARRHAPHPRRRRRPRRRPPADRHRPRGVRHPAGRRSATPGSAPSSGCTSWVRAARPQHRLPRRVVRPPTPSVAARPGPPGRSPARSTTAPASGWRGLVALVRRGPDPAVAAPAQDGLRVGRDPRRRAAGRPALTRPRSRAASGPPTGSTPGASPTRTPTRGTSWCGVPRRRWRPCSARASASWPGRSGSPWSPAPSGWVRCDRADRRADVRHHRRPPDRHDAARGQRRHRQDLDHRRPGHPVRRRGPRHRSSRCWSSRSAARPARSCASGCAPSWSRPSGRWPTPAPVDDPDELLALLLDADEAELDARHGRVREALVVLRRRHHRHHPPVLLAGARLARRRRRHRLRTRAWSRTSPT